MPSVSRKKRFTEQMLERLKPPAAGRVWFSDEVCPGLVLRVSARGTKSFSVIYKVPGEGGVTSRGRLLRGRQHRVTLGAWPVTGLVVAREKARQLLGEATSGNDPRVRMRHPTRATRESAPARAFLLAQPPRRSRLLHPRVWSKGPPANARVRAA